MINDFSKDDEVHLFESDSRPGGHANTVNYVKPGAKSEDSVKVDTLVLLFLLILFISIS